MVTTQTSEILSRAEGVLRTTYSGLEMMRQPSGASKNLGLRNVLVFGRSFTFVLQNLRSTEELFDDWYAPHVDMMKNDEVFLYFKEARNNLEKQGRLGIGTIAGITSLSSENMKKLEADRPPGATAFFVGDNLGGSGWIVPLADGEEQRFYIELPGEIGYVYQHFTDLELEKFPALRGRPTLDLAEHFVSGLDKIFEDAREHFLGTTRRQKYRGRTLPSYIRVVK